MLLDGGPESWARRIARAEHLAGQDANARPLLEFYARLLGLQRDVYTFLRGRADWQPAGSPRDDGVVLRIPLPAMLTAVARHGPEALAVEARVLLDASPREVDELLTAWWQAPSDRRFFPKAVLQPYGQWLAETGVVAKERNATRAGTRCPVCGGQPQVSILQTAGGGSGHGGGRALQCSTCLTVWPCRRVLCVHCGEEDEHKLAYFRSPTYDSLRIDACDTCRHYLKSVDRTRLGLAVPLVDEVAGASLDLWARERGYEKVELNLLGL